MPEGPSIVILKEAVQSFKGKKILSVSGNTSIDKERLLNQKVIDFKSWGKHFLICFPRFTLRVHFMLFGSYSINEERTQKKTRVIKKYLGKTHRRTFYCENCQTLYAERRTPNAERTKPKAKSKNLKAKESGKKKARKKTQTV